MRSWLSWRHATTHDDVIKWKHFPRYCQFCAGNSLPGEFTAERPVTWRFDVFFDLRLNKRLSKQSWGWWFETPSRPLLRHCNANGFWPLDALSHDHELRKNVCIIMCFINTLSVDKMVDIWKKRFYVFFSLIKWIGIRITLKFSNVSGEKAQQWFR